MNRSFRTYLHETAAYFTLGCVFLSGFGLIGNAQTMMKGKTEAKTAINNAKKLTEEQRIIHVLNRLTFGARPGDVEKVKEIGLNAYIEQQLNPTAINDVIAESKVKNLEILKLSTAEIFAKYPNPGGILAVLQQQNGVSRRQALQSRNAREIPANDADKSIKGDTMPKENTMPASNTDRREYREEVAALYQKYGLRRPNEINQQLIASRILRAVYSEKQLNEVMVDFWSNHFNVFIGKNAVRWHLPSYDRDVIRPNALGNFKDLLTATAKSPAMLFYLDNFESVAPNQNQNQRAGRLAEVIKNGNLTPQMRKRIKQQKGISDEELNARIERLKSVGNRLNQRGINENYAREIMELHTIGVDSGYTQQDIKEVARAFTGWTIIDPRGYRKIAAKMISGKEDKQLKRLARTQGFPEDAESGTFFFNEKAHDKGEKIVLGHKIKEGGIKDGEKVIEILVNHPATAKFIARKLAVKFVSDNPSEAFVNRIAAAFQKSKGDIKTTLRAIFTDEEFYAPINYRAKIKTPFEVVVSAIRSLNGDTDGTQIQALLAKMGEPLYGWQAPTGYPDTAEDWVNTGALLERMNYSVALASNRIPGTKVDLAKFLNGRDPDDKEKVLDHFIGVILHGEINANTKATLEKQLAQPLIEPQIAEIQEDDDGLPMMRRERTGGGRGQGRQNVRLNAPSGNAEVYKIVSLILGSPDFQRQ